MSDEEISKAIQDKVEQVFKGEGSGHDWHHIQRVVGNAERIAVKENADFFVCRMSALVHDIGDHKFSNGVAQEVLVKELLDSVQLDDLRKTQILEVACGVSFKGAGVDTSSLSIEGKVVQDADRLDAIGAIGVARCFAYGGSVQQSIYEPEIQPTLHGSFEEYKSTRTSSINHFYEKLLLLKDMMQTKTGKKMAQERHDYLQGFLDQFLGEWNGTK